MKGLLIKDYYLLFQRKQTIFMFLAISLLMGFATDGSFIVGYMAFLSAIISISTISYDEADNGMMFLMTLPVSRKTYAVSKYILGIIMSIAAWVLSIVIMLAVNTMKGIPTEAAEDIFSSVVFLIIALLILDLMIPLQLKFGAEKSRIIMFILFGGIAALAALGMRQAPEAVSSLTAALDKVPGGLLAMGGLLAGCLLTAVSAAASIRIMKKKTF